MIGTAIIAVVGYGLSILFALIARTCPGDHHRAKLAGDAERMRREANSFLGSIILCLGLAILTRWLVGGQF